MLSRPKPETPSRYNADRRVFRCAQHLVYRGLLARHPVRLIQPNGKPGRITSLLHLPRFVPFPPLLPCECLRVRQVFGFDVRV